MKFSCIKFLEAMLVVQKTLCDVCGKDVGHEGHTIEIKIDIIRFEADLCQDHISKIDDVMRWLRPIIEDMLLRRRRLLALEPTTSTPTASYDYEMRGQDKKIGEG